jgi:hypothetical protein
MMEQNEVAPGDDWDWVAQVVHPREVGDMSIKEVSPILISDTWRSKRETLDGRARREMKLHEERLELCKGSAKRVADLQIPPRRESVWHPGRVYPFFHNGEGRTRITLVEECSAIKLRTSARILIAVFLCTSANPSCTLAAVGILGNSVLSGAMRSNFKSVMSAKL